MRCDFSADFLGVRHKSLDFMNEERFSQAWDIAEEAGRIGWNGKTPNIRWRTHINIWAAQNGLNLEGDFVECGVHTGIFSLAICHYFDLSKLDKKFWLFDTWAGIPTDGLAGDELNMATHHNEEYYPDDIFNHVKQSFANIDGAHLVRGLLPGTIDEASIDKISYLSIDLNNAPAEEATIKVLWPKLTKGAFVVLDDYGWNGHENQRNMWNDFAKSVGQMIVTLPTGQGLLIKN